MYKDNHYVNAGTIEFHRWGHKSQEKLEACLEAKNGFLSVPADGGKHWTIGTSNGKFGEFAKYGEVFFSVNKGGFVWVKEGSEKEAIFKKMIVDMINHMKNM